MKFEYIQRATDYCVCVLNSRQADRYEWSSSLKDMKVSALHIMDTTFSWYHGCIDKVRPLLDQYKPVKIVGVSMGGYAALLFGSLHGIKVKAFAPQTTLKKCRWDERWEEEWFEVRKKTKYPEYLDLADMQHNADIYYCLGSEEDGRHAGRIKGAKLIPRGCKRHEDAGVGIDPHEIFDI